MALSVDDVAKIQVDVSLGRELRVKGEEAEAMAEAIRKDLAEMEKEGISPMVLREVPEPDESDGTHNSDDVPDSPETDSGELTEPTQKKHTPGGRQHDQSSHGRRRVGQPMATIITSQEYIDEETVAEKQRNEDYLVKVSPEFEVDGETFQVVIDGHHSLEAAKRDGVEPEYEIATGQDHDAIGMIAEGRIEEFLEAVYHGHDYRNAITGDWVW